MVGLGQGLVLYGGHVCNLQKKTLLLFKIVEFLIWGLLFRHPYNLIFTSLFVYGPYIIIRAV
ncbi:hypothetical protein HanIR_Chr10g0462061 [Helianthus annuus]|nr:hypothetical protein HanIR_Chr10g0462061 [Helianthus annuus]